ncbi:Z-ring formation inhibitor MciZ [Paenibacillus puldeungensis]|uniref:Z-ring formation inhibitor MciZ n=1 Tax=Paenibacillus puldeungensis TaxID=696536 RepID=A0ABW3RUW7_9BACL
MKSYFTPSCIRAQGKAWQIRILLSQWLHEAGATAKVTDLIHIRMLPESSAAGAHQ